MTKINTIVEAFDKTKPLIAADYIAHIEKEVSWVIENHADAILNHFKSSKLSSFIQQRIRQVRPFLKMSSDRPDSTVIGTKKEHLEKTATLYADAQVASFTSKLIKKLANLDDCEVSHQSMAGTFTIKGTIKGKKVVVSQSCVFKISPNGLPFNQWPALIYVDGKFTPETVFKNIT